MRELGFPALELSNLDDGNHVSLFLWPHNLVCFPGKFEASKG
jgi:hypothetical protein